MMARIKRILLIYKKSAYDAHFGRGRKLARFANIKRQELARFERTHDTHYETLKEVERVLRQRKVRYIKAARGQKVDVRRFDLVLTVGGDGTFLEGARRVKGQLMFGVNSDPQWSVGRFCNADKFTFAAALERILAGKFRVQRINRLQLRLNGRAPIDVVNDVLVCHANPAAMSRYYLVIDGKRERHRSSGIWVATAAGSTGALRSAGGKALPLTSTDIQYRVRELYYGRKAKFALTKGTLKKGQPLRVVSIMEDGVIYVDGANLCLPFLFGDEAVLSSSPRSLKVVQL